MANVNRFPGLFRGPVDHQSSSVINLKSKGTIDMGDAVKQDQGSLTSNDIFPPVLPTTTLGDPLVYGIAVGGDLDGIFGDGSASTDDSTRATNGEGQGVVVVTQGRCPARVTGAVGGLVVIGDELVASDTDGALQKHTAAGQTVIAIAMNSVAATDTDIILVDVQRSVRHAV